MDLRLAIFDCDGTLVDSQHSIVEAMQRAFDHMSLVCPSRETVLAGVGLSLPDIMARLVPEADAAFHLELAEAYKRAFQALRADGTIHEPLYDGIADLLDTLEAQGWLLAVATGKSDRGLRLVLDQHGLRHRFVALETADRHPSKPHPAMIDAALAIAGVAPANAVMIGDTSFDMLMSVAAGVRPLGVGWGYHKPDELLGAGAHSVAMDAEQLATHIGLA